MSMTQKTVLWLPEALLSTSVASCSKPHQLPGFPPWGLHCPKSRSDQDTAQDLGSFQDDKFRQLPGMESLDCSAGLH